MFQTLNEKIKTFLKSNKKDTIVNQANPDYVLDTLDSQDTTKAIYASDFFDDSILTNYSFDEFSSIENQVQKIQTYRELAMQPDVSNAIDEIINEIIFSIDKKIFKININEENDNIRNAIQESFEKLCSVMNINKTLYSIVRQSYIDGQLVLHCQFNRDLKDGIQKVVMLEPSYLYFDDKEDCYMYLRKSENSYTGTKYEKGEKFSKDEIVFGDFGLRDNDDYSVKLSYLEGAIKPANQLKNLEDLLIPLRFSRSVSRRVFNVDCGELSNSQVEQVMKDFQKKFKYKKFYDTKTGEISNNQHIQTMVEDYWFANRSGNKGTQVDLLDETGNLGEIGDILYFQKKLYNALKVPTSRVLGNPDGDNTFDFESTSASYEDVKFFNFISRLRLIYTDIFMELLKRQIVSTGIMNLDDFNSFREKIEIRFNSENLFIEKMKLSQFQQKLEMYSLVQEYSGKLFPVRKVLKEVFSMSDDEVEDNFKEIQKEQENPLFKNFYSVDDY